jgi:hypothetical protein
MAKREPHNAVRGVDQAAWKDSVAAAAALHITHGQWLSEAIRRHLAAGREPIGAGVSVESAPHWGDAPLSVMVGFDAWTRTAQFRANLRTGRVAGRIPEAEQRAFRQLYDEAVRALSGAPSPPAAGRAIADDLHLDRGDTDLAHPQRIGRSARQIKRAAGDERSPVVNHDEH